MYAWKGGASAHQIATGTGLSVTYTPTAGNLLTIFTTHVNADTVSITDNLGTSNTYLPAISEIGSGGGGVADLFYAQNCQGGSTQFTATYAPTDTYLSIRVDEWSGFA